MLDDPESIVEYAWHFKGFEARVGVRIDTLVIDRELFSRGQGYTLTHQSTKEKTQSDIDQALPEAAHRPRGRCWSEGCDES